MRSKVHFGVLDDLVRLVGRQLEFDRVQRVHPAGVALGPADACIEKSQDIQGLNLHIVCGVVLVVGYPDDDAVVGAVDLGDGICFQGSCSYAAGLQEMFALGVCTWRRT